MVAYWACRREGTRTCWQVWCWWNISCCFPVSCTYRVWSWVEVRSSKTSSEAQRRIRQTLLEWTMSFSGWPKHYPQCYWSTSQSYSYTVAHRRDCQKCWMLQVHYCRRQFDSVAWALTEVNFSQWVCRKSHSKNGTKKSVAYPGCMQGWGWRKL